ncbi:MAG: hypothetical protein WB689_28385, partial [Xanthobacteraceae bacterium]
MNRARTYHCTRMRHCIKQSNGLVPSLLCPSWVDYIIATRGYDFRKGQDKPNEYVPTGCPGGRAPHLWLGDEHSLYDAFGFEFTFLRLGA